MVEADKQIIGTQNQMGLLGAISYILGNIVGSGIFITPTAILQNTSSVGLALVLWVASGIISMLGSFSYVELGTSINASGADFAYACFVEWYALAFCYMCIGSLVQLPAVVAIQAQTFSEYLFVGLNLNFCEKHTFFTPYLARKLVELCLISVLVFINFFSLRKFVSRFNIVAVGAKIMAALTIICIGGYCLLVKGHITNFQHPFKNSTFKPMNITSALFAGLYTFDGWDILNFGTEDIYAPKRTMPLAILFGMTIVCVLYVGINVAYFTVLNIRTFLSSTAVASTLVEATLGKQFTFLMPTMICLLLIGSLNATIFVAGRLMHSAAKAGFLPTFISCTNLETESPRAALLVHFLLVAIMTLSADLNSLLNCIGFAQWTQRGVTMLVLFYIRYKKQTAGNTEVIRAPLVVPLIFFAVCFALATLTIINDLKTALVTILLLLITSLVYVTFIYENTLPSHSWFVSWSSKFDSFTTSIFQVMLNTMPQKVIIKKEAKPKKTKKSRIHAIGCNEIMKKTKENFSDQLKR